MLPVFFSSFLVSFFSPPSVVPLAAHDDEQALAEQLLSQPLQRWQRRARWQRPWQRFEHEQLLLQDEEQLVSAVEQPLLQLLHLLQPWQP